MADRIWNAEERAILESRTRSLARPATPAERRAVVEAVALRIAGERYALEAEVVLGVAAVERISALPHAPPHVAGLMHRAGAVLPVFHLRAVLELPLAALPEHGRVVLIGHRHPELALAVDRVETVRAVVLDSLRPAPDSFSGGARALLRGLDSDGVPLIDGQALLASDRLVVDIPLPQRGPR